MCHQSQPCQVRTGEQHLLLPKGLSKGGIGAQSLHVLEPLIPESRVPFPPSVPPPVLLGWHPSPLLHWPQQSVDSNVFTSTSGPLGLGSSHVHKRRTRRPTHSGWTLLS